MLEAKTKNRKYAVVEIYKFFIKVPIFLKILIILVIVFIFYKIF